MKEELTNLLSFKNEKFVFECFKLLLKKEIKDEDIDILISLEKTNTIIKTNNRYTYPIIKEVPELVFDENIYCFEKNNRRYYSEPININGKYYILCNDWYYPSEGKKNTKDTRTPFLKWLETKVF